MLLKATYTVFWLCQEVRDLFLQSTRKKTPTVCYLIQIQFQTKNVKISVLTQRAAFQSIDLILRMAF